jgi:hypothetical protein
VPHAIARYVLILEALELLVSLVCIYRLFYLFIFLFSFIIFYFVVVVVVDRCA